MFESSLFLPLLEKLECGNAGEIIAGLEQFKIYLLAVNTKINLVSRQESSQVIDNLIYDSLAMLPYLHYPAKARLLDIGSGAGFPWIVHKFVYPTLQIVSVDSTARKIEFQRAVVKLLKWSDCSLHAVRVETLKPQNADFCIAKAVASVERVCRMARRHLAPSGILVLPRSLRAPTSDLFIIDRGYTIGNEVIYESTVDHREAKLLMLVKD